MSRRLLAEKDQQIQALRSLAASTAEDLDNSQLRLTCALASLCSVPLRFSSSNPIQPCFVPCEVSFVQMQMCNASSGLVIMWFAAKRAGPMQVGLSLPKVCCSL